MLGPRRSFDAGAKSAGDPPADSITPWNRGQIVISRSWLQKRRNTMS
jgi:hypothetical protein